MLSEKELDDSGDPGVPKLSPDFLIETYLDHQVRHLILRSSIELELIRAGREVLSHLRCKLDDLPLESDGLVRHDRSCPHIPCEEVQYRLSGFSTFPLPFRSNPHIDVNTSRSEIACT